MPTYVAVPHYFLFWPSPSLFVTFCCSLCSCRRASHISQNFPGRATASCMKMRLSTKMMMIPCAGSLSLSLCVLDAAAPARKCTPFYRCAKHLSSSFPRKSAKWAQRGGLEGAAEVSASNDDDYFWANDVLWPAISENPDALCQALALALASAVATAPKATRCPSFI